MFQAVVVVLQSTILWTCGPTRCFPCREMVISHLDYCNSLLARLPASATTPLQRIQNAVAVFVYNLPKFSHVTPLLLPVAARIQFKTMVLAFKAVNGTAPVYLQTLVRPHAPARALAHLRQLADWYHHC